MEPGENKEAYGKSVEERRADVAAFIGGEVQLAKHVFDEKQKSSDALKAFESRPYQLEAWQALWQARDNGTESALLHLATGLGKTSIAVLDYAKFSAERQEAGLPAPRGLFICHQDVILTQASERFYNFMPQASQHFFKTRQDALPDTDMTFATFQGMRNELYRFKREHFDYIVYDEAHHTKANSYERVVKYFTP